MAYIGMPSASAMASIQTSLTASAKLAMNLDGDAASKIEKGAKAGEAWAKRLVDHQRKAADCEAKAMVARSAIVQLLDSDFPIELRVPLVLASLLETEDQALVVKMSEIMVVYELECAKRARKSAPDAAEFHLPQKSSEALGEELNAWMDGRRSSMRAMAEAIERCQSVVAAVIRGG